MSGLVIDCSVIMGLCFEDEFSEYHGLLLDKFTSTPIFAPSIWTSEVGNVLTVAERRKRITEADSFRFINLLSALPITKINTPVDQIPDILAFAREYGLSFYDAEYLRLAITHGYTLATLDAALLTAAKYAGAQTFN